MKHFYLNDDKKKFERVFYWRRKILCVHFWMNNSTGLANKLKLNDDDNDLFFKNSQWSYRKYYSNPTTTNVQRFTSVQF